MEIKGLKKSGFTRKSLLTLFKSIEIITDLSSENNPDINSRAMAIALSSLIKTEADKIKLEYEKYEREEINRLGKSSLSKLNAARKALGYDEVEEENIERKRPRTYSLPTRVIALQQKSLKLRQAAERNKLK